jgi:hypothetical protein
LREFLRLPAFHFLPILTVANFSIVAMQMSDACYSPTGSGIEPLQILHVMPYPLVSIPAFVQNGKGDSPTFLPLDSILNNVSSRKDDPISFNYSHSTPKKTKARRGILRKLMDGASGSESDETPDSVGPYAVVGDKYVDFVRSGAIKCVLGKLIRLEGQEKENTQVSDSFHDVSVLFSLIGAQLTCKNAAGDKLYACQSEPRLWRT